jgi:hypothetical protein
MKFGRLELVALVVASTCTIASQAHASVEDYCAAYARDIADAVSPKPDDWQRRYDNAEKSCATRYALPKPATRKTIKTVKKPDKPPLPKVKVEAEKVEKPVKQEKKEKQAVRAVPLLKEGSPEWVAYCKNKYVSFNEAKGTYTSKTGVERRCLVTAN